MLKTILSFILFFGLTAALSAQYQWDGGGDGTSWEDPDNWAKDFVPPTDSVVAFVDTVTVTGQLPNSVAGIRIQARAHVTLNLDMTIDNSSSGEHLIVVADSAMLTLGTEENPRTFLLTAPDNKHVFAAFGNTVDATITVMPGTSVEAGQGTTFLNLASPTSTFVNHGSLILGADYKDGFRIDGTFENTGTISGGGMKNDLFILREGGSLTNGAEGSITSTAAGDDGIEIASGSSLINHGTLNLISPADGGGGNSGIAVGANEEAGTFINTGTVTLDGGEGENPRALYVYPMGTVTNQGVITAGGGNTGAAIYVEGQFTIDSSATVRLPMSRINVDAAGSLINNGLISADRDGPGIFSAGTVTNNAFFLYDNASNFAAGSGSVTDNGIRVKSGDTVRINAGGACFVDLTDVPYAFMVDGEDYGMPGDTGRFDFTEESIAADSVILTTATYPEVVLRVTNICPAAVMISTGLRAAERRPLRVYPTVGTSGQPRLIDLTNVPAERLELMVYNASGSLVGRTVLSGGGTRSFKLDQQPAGVYFLRATDGKLLLTTRLIISE